MRTGHHGANLVRNDEGEPFGIFLGADFCAEHEWGIRQLKYIFGINEKGYGVAKRTVTEVPDNLLLLEDNFTEAGKKHKDLVLMLWSSYVPLGTPLKKYSMAHYFGISEYKPQPFVGAWDEKEFAIRARDPEVKEFLKDLYTAFQEKNVMLSVGRTVFLIGDYGGLGLTIVSRIPKNIKDDMAEADKDHEAMLKEVKAMGIEEQLKKAGKAYFALSPRRKEDGSIQFWLNPEKQDKNNFGWFTLEQLQQWANNEGPIPKESMHSK